MNQKLAKEINSKKWREMQSNSNEGEDEDVELELPLIDVNEDELEQMRVSLNVGQADASEFVLKIVADGETVSVYITGTG